MKNKKVLLVVLAIVLVFGMTVVGCDNSDSGNGNGNGGEDTWSNVTSFSQLDGTWKAPSTYTGNTQGGITVSGNTSNYIVTINATAKTMSTSGTATITLSGGNVNEIWPDLKDSLEYMNQQNGITVTFNDTNHSYTMTCNNFSLALTDNDLAEIGFQINQNGTKLKISQDGIEIIYTKQ
jgi:hypothetical protein